MDYHYMVVWVKRGISNLGSATFPCQHHTSYIAGIKHSSNSVNVVCDIQVFCQTKGSSHIQNKRRGHFTR
ncbi:MAG: hypothetical protein RLZZ350_2421 [Verrucomicrobiota bacterium]